MHGDPQLPNISTPGPAHSITPITSFTNLQFAALASALVGIQVCWAVQAGYVTKSLLELGLSERLVSLAWLAGPIAGMVVQPIVGVLSDRCTSPLGRRRPFLIAGTLVSMLSLLTFAFARQLGAHLGDSLHISDTEFAVRPRALTIAISAFWVLDFAINAAQGPLRTLLVDVVPHEQHKKGNASFALATGLGNCIGSFLGSVKLSSWFPFFPGDLEALFSISALILALLVACTVFFIREHPQGYQRVGEWEGETQKGLFHSGFFEAAFTAPPSFFRVFTVQCFMWFGWFCLFVFGTSWVGSDVYGGSFQGNKGSEELETYQMGVRVGNMGMGLQSLVTIACSLVLPQLLQRFGKQGVYITASSLHAMALLAAPLVRGRMQAWIAVVMFASTGFAWAVTMTVPWSIMSEAVAIQAPEKAGIYFTMFNLSQCFPEVALSLVAGGILSIVKRKSGLLAVGGGVVLMGALLIRVLDVGTDTDKEEKEGEEAFA